MKPYVICHMCTTIDGKILVDRWGKLPGRNDGASLFESTAESFGVGRLAGPARRRRRPPQSFG